MTEVRFLLLDPESGSCTSGGEELLAQWQSSDSAVLWVDINGVPGPAENGLLTGMFGINRFTLSDIRRDRHPPKCEFMGDHVFVIMTGLTADTDTLDYRLLKISLLTGERFFVSQHNGTSLGTDRLWQQVTETPGSGPVHPAALCYRLCRYIIDRYTPIITSQEQRLEELEAAIFGFRGDRHLAELVEINTRLKKLRRIFNYLRSLFDEVQSVINDNGNEKLLHRRDLPGFRDVWDHVDRLTTFLELFQELAVDLMQGYMGVSAHKLNNIMKTLTLVTVVFLPLSLMVGVYGMNFSYIPELGWKYGYFALLAVMATLAGTILLFFKRKKWLE